MGIRSGPTILRHIFWDGELWGADGVHVVEASLSHALPLNYVRGIKRREKWSIAETGNPFQPQGCIITSWATFCGMNPRGGWDQCQKVGGVIYETLTFVH